MQLQVKRDKTDIDKSSTQNPDFHDKEVRPLRAQDSEQD